MSSDYILDLTLNTIELAEVPLDYEGQYAIKLAIQNRKEKHWKAWLWIWEANLVILFFSSP